MAVSFIFLFSYLTNSFFEINSKYYTKENSPQSDTTASSNSLRPFNSQDKELLVAMITLTIPVLSTAVRTKYQWISDPSQICSSTTRATPATTVALWATPRSSSTQIEFSPMISTKMTLGDLQTRGFCWTLLVSGIRLIKLFSRRLFKIKLWRRI